MSQKDNTVELLTGKNSLGKKSRIPAKLDFLQSATGLFLALFITFHILFESSILFGKEAMYRLTKMFEGEPFIEGGEPLIITALAILIFSMFIFHAFLAMRKFPASYKEYQRYRAHRELLKHQDTNLWFIQITTGFAMFFLGSIHLYMMMTQPEKIGPYASADRIFSDWMWPMYLLLLISVVLHAWVGVYRLIIKWGWFDGEDPRKNRQRSKLIIKVLIAVYLFIGLVSLASYMKIGYDHQDDYGSRYVTEKMK
ncbi:MAG TPA: fumarate reductase cytochrome b subunit [Epsilonproteobacteria bacterium]|nr:fumarate reductase cytochrome b subunit [Campylobacterota bacterium]